MPRFVPGGSLDGGCCTPGCASAGSPLAQCSSITLDFGGGDSSFRVQRDGWLSTETSPRMYTVPALPPALDQDCSPRTNHLVPTRSNGESHDDVHPVISTHCASTYRTRRFCSCEVREEHCSRLICVSWASSHDQMRPKAHSIVSYGISSHVSGDKPSVQVCRSF